MHVIIPAADMVSMLFQSLLTYACRYDNRMVHAMLLGLEHQRPPSALRREPRLQYKNVLELAQLLKRSDTTKTGRPPYEARLLRHFCYCIVNSLLQDLVDRRCTWKTPAQHLDRTKGVLAVMFPEWNGAQVLALCDHFVNEVIDPLEDELSAWLSNYMSGAGWHVWTVEEIGSDLVLSKGEDYRVLDWERRMASGEWKQEYVPDSAPLPTINAGATLAGHTASEIEEINEIILKQPMERRRGIVGPIPRLTRTIPGAGVRGPLCTRGEEGTEIYVMEESPLLQGRYGVRRLR